jgi:nucleotide-binding universal stress UspA family protein
MRALVWITENTWEACTDQAAAILDSGDEVTLLHVSASDVEALAAGGAAGLLGRRHPPEPGPPLRAIAEEDARALLDQARARFGRPAELAALRGRVEREVVGACVGFDLLILARDGQLRLGPHSIGPRSRFVLDHAPCQVLLLWPAEPPGVDTIPRPPRHPEHPPGRRAPSG